VVEVIFELGALRDSVHVAGGEGLTDQDAYEYEELAIRAVVAISSTK
jgi:hypothetical protein